MPEHTSPLHIVFDRDGTLIRHIHYLGDPGRVDLLPGVAPGLARLKHAGFTLYLHTNQSGIARGHFTLEDAVACNKAMIKLIGLGNEVFAEICIAAEHPDHKPMFRKPSPAWARSLMQKRGLNPENLCYVGDNVSDLLTARNIGCSGIGVRTGVADLEENLAAAGLNRTFPIMGDFTAVVEYLIKGRI